MTDQDRKAEALFDNGRYALCRGEDGLSFVEGETVYDLSCHAYEPCFYLNEKESAESVIIHNSFTVSEIIRLSETGGKTMMITGNRYDLEGVCHLLHLAVSCGYDSTDIGYLEGLWVMEKLERDGAYCPWDAVDIRKYGIENVRMMHPFEHSGKVRKTATGRFYINKKEK
ncbi:MAG: hypothetical protein IJM15_01675 [Erysipelotrichaceae bacterium]|nr:hypothetical protein [Erysipelotrichaceae bacterium]